MARALSGLNINDLNPRFFAYGQFPLYLSFFTGQILNFIFGIKFGTALSFSTSVYLLRFYSALSVLLLFFFSKKIYQNLFPKHSPHLILLLSALTPGLIQIAHFGTTEALLSLVFVSNIYLSLLLLKSKKLPQLIFLSSLVTAIGLASKLTALFFVLPPLISLFFLFFSSPKKLKIILLAFTYLFLTLSLSVLLSPYNFISFPEFLSSMTYEVSVARGTLDVFYTRQFRDTVAYLFQLKKIYPFALGVPTFLFSLASLPLLILSSFKASSLFRKKLLILILPVLTFFLYNAGLYSKWTRFLAPTFFLFPILTTYLILSLKGYLKKKKKIFLSSFLPLFLVIIVILPGFMFLRTYFSPDVRVQATTWMIKNIPSESVVLSEAGNVVNIPLTSPPFVVNNFDFYELHQQENPILSLSSVLFESDYIIIPSRRIFKNHSTSNFPITQKYYNLLFSKKLGFTPLKTFSDFPRIEALSLVLEDESAEETWSVFDHPVVRIYKKTTPLSSFEYQKLLTTITTL